MLLTTESYPIRNAAALDLYDSVVHPRTYAERQTRTKIVEMEKKKKIKALKGLLSERYGDGQYARETRTAGQRRSMTADIRSNKYRESYGPYIYKNTVPLPLQPLLAEVPMARSTAEMFKWQLAVLYASTTFLLVWT